MNNDCIICISMKNYYYYLSFNDFIFQRIIIVILMNDDCY